MTQQVIITLEFPAEGPSEEWEAIRSSLIARGWRSWSVVAHFWCKEWDCKIPRAEIQKAVREDLSLAAITAKLGTLKATVLTYNADPQTIAVGLEASDHEEPPPEYLRGPCS